MPADRRKGHIEGLPWEIEPEGSGWRITIGEVAALGRGLIRGSDNIYTHAGIMSFHVSTPDGYAGLFRLIEALKDITRPVLSEAV